MTCCQQYHLGLLQHQGRHRRHSLPLLDVASISLCNFLGALQPIGQHAQQLRQAGGVRGPGRPPGVALPSSCEEAACRWGIGVVAEGRSHAAGQKDGGGGGGEGALWATGPAGCGAAGGLTTAGARAWWYTFVRFMSIHCASCNAPRAVLPAASAGSLATSCSSWAAVRCRNCIHACPSEASTSSTLGWVERWEAGSG